MKTAYECAVKLTGDIVDGGDFVLEVTGNEPMRLNFRHGLLAASLINAVKDIIMAFKKFDS